MFLMAVFGHKTNGKKEHAYIMIISGVDHQKRKKNKQNCDQRNEPKWI